MGTYHAGPARDAGMSNGYGVPTLSGTRTTDALRRMSAVPSLAVLAYALPSAAAAASQEFNLDACVAASTATPRTAEVNAVLRGRVVRQHIPTPTPQSRCVICNGYAPDTAVGSPTGRVRLLHAACKQNARGARGARPRTLTQPLDGTPAHTDADASTPHADASTLEASRTAHVY
jgi:hypothetical protein